MNEINEIYDRVTKRADTLYGSIFLKMWREMMEECLRGRSSVSREWFLALHEIVCEEAAHKTLEVLR